MIKSRKTIRKFLACFITSLFVVNSLLACTTFVIHDSSILVYGRNFDWDLGNGFIVINKRGLTKQAMVKPPYEPARWISKYGSITFNQIGVDAPMGGMNEKGLVIASMALFETKYPEINGKNVVNDLEWIQFQLDNSSTLDEVIENSNKVNIDPLEIIPIHYMVCDSLGNIGVIEFLDGKVVITKGKDISIPVCSNATYAQILRAPATNNIIATANSMIRDYKHTDNPVDYSFKILKAVGSDTRTQWSIVFDIKNRRINYKTLNNKSVRTLNFDDFDFTCDNEIPILDIQKSNSEKELPGKFENLTFNYYYNYKKELIRMFNANIKGVPQIPESFIKSEVEYAINKRKCN